ncbi:hypothetical protein CONPUDRAFT_115584 [Coniophora puteana RWD-64-598 SS2]|uniref:Protein byr4 n=1 Tax=Coniophora puteana (strain RWD-64-598) TaxID=741705 RepID=A0A5M3N6I8_CONPW|nr:uncharacterized protein CONPUDRAFT_115584 [Coniophora puteana RWD-64-598 SS2]EIW86837.1 hypothetical protein CONPUDRAFT_115584 [Coniophora puteana RWD-64-598 SS2]
MPTIPAPVTPTEREEWPDADFDLREGDHLPNLHVDSDKEDDDWDWDEEMDLGKTGVKAQVTADSSLSRTAGLPSGMITIRPPLTSQGEDADEDEDEEGFSTIKMTALPQHKPLSNTAPSAFIDEDIESAFALPSDLTQLSLAPLPLSHRSSKNSLEWGDKDQTSSSHSSDAYSTFGFGAAASSSSNSVTTVSLLDSEDSGCEDVSEGELDGLIIPSGMFDKGQSGKYLKKMLELKKTAQSSERLEKAASPHPDDDFESGLVIEDDDFNPSRLLIAQHSSKLSSRRKSAPSRPNLARPHSRARMDRAKSPVNPPISSARQLQRLKLSSSPPPQTVAPRAQSYKEALSSALPVSNAATLLSTKPGSLRGQKSHTGLKPPTPPSTQRKQLTRKASLSSLMETSSQALDTGQAPVAGPSTTKTARYEAPTAASRAKSHTSSTSRMHQLDYMVPPTRPTTPSSNPAALRLTMPTAMRSKSRPSLTAIFAASPAIAVPPLPPHRSTSPAPPRPPSTQSLRTRGSQPRPQSTAPSATAPKLLRKPKRLRTYGDGTELDGFDDLPTDRDKEGQYRVQPKGANRITGSGHSKASEKDPLQERKTGRRGSIGSGKYLHGAANPNSLRRTVRIEFPSGEKSLKKKKEAPSPQARKKPTLIRQMGGTNAPKVVGEMKWNPSTLRWEGNDQALRDFDAAVGTSARPALITHLTGSSIGSPVGSFAAGARKVGNMIFDPTRMCWISTLPADEEPDVFADLADDEDDYVWETKGGTIRASQQTGGTTNPCEPSLTSVATALNALSPASSRTRTISESGDSDRGSRASIFFDVDDDFVERCRAAEERHRSEMKGWRSALSRQVDTVGEPDRQELYEIRALATRKY